MLFYATLRCPVCLRRQAADAQRFATFFRKSAARIVAPYAGHSHDSVTPEYEFRTHMHGILTAIAETFEEIAEAELQR